MRLSVSFEMVMQLAAQETNVGNFDYILPEHLLMALLRISEIGEEELSRMMLSPLVKRAMAEEISDLRQALTTLSMDSAQVRRDLRSQLGKGSGSGCAGQMHRSPASREAFDLAAQKADNNSSDTVCMSHLLAALLETPTPAMYRLLGDITAQFPADDRRAAAHTEAPLLHALGTDLTQLVRERKIPAVANRQAEARALIAAMDKPGSPLIALICEAIPQARAVVIAAVQAIQANEAPPALRSIRVIGIGFTPGCQEVKPQWLAAQLGLQPLSRVQDLCPRCTLVRDPEFNKPVDNGPDHGCEQCLNVQEDGGDANRVLVEAAKNRSIALMVPALWDVSINVAPSPWIASLARCDTQPRCLWPMTPAAYERLVREGFSRKAVLQAMWIQPQRSDNIPCEI